MSLLWRATEVFVDQNHVWFNAGALDDRPADNFARNLFDHIKACPVRDSFLI